VCGYDIKTGKGGLTAQRISELRAAAISYYETRNTGLSPRQVVILEVKPWR